MTKFWFGIGHSIQALLDLVLTPFGWAPVVIFSLVLTFGGVYWLVLQSRFTRMAKEKGGHI
jgi:hypothetical protein